MVHGDRNARGLGDDRGLHLDVGQVEHREWTTIENLTVDHVYRDVLVVGLDREDLLINEIALGRIEVIAL